MVFIQAVGQQGTILWKLREMEGISVRKDVLHVPWAAKAGHRREAQMPNSNQLDQQPDFQHPRITGLSGSPAINREDFGGENLTGIFISEELWNKGLVSVVVITWEANCYFSWWGWFSEASAEKMHLPSTEGCGGGREWPWPLLVTFLSFFFFFFCSYDCCYCCCYLFM